MILINILRDMSHGMGSNILLVFTPDEEKTYIAFQPCMYHTKFGHNKMQIYKPVDIIHVNPIVTLLCLILYVNICYTYL